EPCFDESMLSSGRGILMIKTFMTDVRYDHGGRRIIMTLNRPTQRPVAIGEPARAVPLRADGSVDWDAAYRAGGRTSLDAGHATMSQISSVQRVLLEIQATLAPVYLPAEVSGCRQIDDGNFQLTCHFRSRSNSGGFIALDDDEDLEEIDKVVGGLLRQQNTNPLDGDPRRAHPRFIFTERIGVAATAQDKPGFAFARDLSGGGVAFIFTRDLSVGSSVVVFLPQTGGRSLRLQTEVVRCIELVENVFDVGVRFTGWA
ncbi:MAG: PilZ domain-containing protein, partial [Planctomycetia bacterium]